MSALDRRAFLKGLAAATAGGAVAPAIRAQPPQRAADPVWKKAPCTLCPMECGLLIRVQDGRAVAVKGDTESPVSRGLACAKGYHGVQALYARDRITRALVRRQGALVPAPLGEALDLVARRLQESVAQHGKDSVAYFGAAHASLPDEYLAAKLFGGAIGTSRIDTAARLHSASASAGHISSFGADGSVGCYEDVEHADVFVLWNENLAETNPMLFSRMLARRRTNPGVLIIDLATRTTRTSYGADRSVLFAPNAELVIANAICHELIARKLIDRNFIERHVAFKKGRTGIGYGLSDDVMIDDVAADTSFDGFADFLTPYTADHAQQLGGIRAEDVRWIASLYGDRARRVMSVWGDAVNQHPRGTWLNNALFNIHLLTGKIATPGNSALCVSGSARDVVGTMRAAEPALLARTWRLPQREAPAAESSALQLFRDVEAGRVNFLWIQSADPLLTLPQPQRYRRAVAKADCFMVVSAAYATPTTDSADVVLPAALWIETEAVYANAERRVQHHERLVSPPGEALSDGWQLIEVARRLGHAAQFGWERDRYAAEAWTEYAQLQAQPRTRPPALSTLRAGAGALWPQVDGAETKWRYHTAHDPAAERARGDFDFYGHADHRAWIWLRPHEPPPESTDNAFPVWLTTGAVLEHAANSALTRRVPALHRAMPHAFAELNAADARALAVRSGDRVRITSRRGVLDIEVRIDQRSQPPRGVVFVPTFDEAYPINTLALDSCCPLSGQPAGQATPVRLTRASAETTP